MAAPMSRRSRRTRWVSVGIVLALLAVSAFLCSPWHTHNRSLGQACSFSSFEHAAGSEPTAYLPLPAPAILGALEACPESIQLAPGLQKANPGRSPPLYELV